MVFLMVHIIQVNLDKTISKYGCIIKLIPLGGIVMKYLYNLLCALVKKLKWVLEMLMLQLTCDQ